MKQTRPRIDQQALEQLATRVTCWAGSTPAFGLACGTIIVWVLTGPVFRYSDTWQLVINTGTTIITFLMVFLIQRCQNKDSLAIHLKLNELVAAVDGASNRLIEVESLSEEELHVLGAALPQARQHGEARRESDEVTLGRGSGESAQRKVAPKG